MPISLAYVSDSTLYTQQMQLLKGKKISIQPNKGLSSLSHHQGGIVSSMINTSELQKGTAEIFKIEKTYYSEKMFWTASIGRMTQIMWEGQALLFAFFQLNTSPKGAITSM